MRTIIDTPILTSNQCQWLQQFTNDGYTLKPWLELHKSMSRVYVPNALQFEVKEALIMAHTIRTWIWPRFQKVCDTLLLWPYFLSIRLVAKIGGTAYSLMWYFVTLDFTGKKAWDSYKGLQMQLALICLTFAAYIPYYLTSFLISTSQTEQSEYLRLGSLGVIGALVKVSL